MAKTDGKTAPESVQIVAEFAEESRKQYARTKEWTTHPGGSCMTIRVPVALLNRIREMADEFGIAAATGAQQ